ncbi:MAG TPA: ribosome maturation factor RimM [Myxococcota bacterium]
MAARVTPTPGVTADGWVSLGVIARAHGIRGALKLHLWQEGGAVLRGGLDVRIGAKQHRVATYAAHILVVDGVPDKTAADLLQGQELFVRRADFPVDEDDVYLVDLVGASVEDERGHKLGIVAGISDNGAQPLLLVHGHGKEVMVPYVDAIVLEASPERVLLRPPAGLFDDADAVVDETSGEFDEPTS